MSKTTATKRVAKTTTKPTQKKAAGLPKIRKGASIRFRSFRGAEGTGTYVGVQGHANGAYHELKVDGESYKVRTGQILSVNGVAV